MLYITKYLSYCVLTHLPTISALCTTHCDHFVYWIMIHCTLQKLHLNDICYCVLIWCKMFQIFILLCITQHYMYWCQLSILILWHVRLDPGYSTCHNVFNPHAIFFNAKVSNSMCYVKELLWDRYRMTHQIRYKLKWYGSLGKIQRTQCNDLACMKNVTCWFRIYVRHKLCQQNQKLTVYTTVWSKSDNHRDEL